MEPRKAHVLRPEDVLATFDVRPDFGLSAARVEESRAKYGRNGVPLIFASSVLVRRVSSVSR
jgi:Cation transporter/ATPase, N-terminus